MSPTTHYTLAIISQRCHLNCSAPQKQHTNAFIVLNTVLFYSFYIWRILSEVIFILQQSICSYFNLPLRGKQDSVKLGA